MSEKNKGFTLIELISIIIILAVIGMFVVPKFFGNDFKKSADFTNFSVNIKYARGKSMVEGGGWSIKINSSAKNYEIYDNNNQLAELPSGDKNPVNVHNSISYTCLDTLNDDRFYFNNLGQPALSDNNSDLIRHRIIVEINGRKLNIEPFSGGIYE